MRDNLRVKEVRLDGDTQRRFIICHNPDEAERAKARRDELITRLTGELARIDTARARTAKRTPASAATPRR